MLQGHLNKDVFRKGKRETLNEEFIRIAKKKNIPAPGSYKFPIQRIQNIAKSNEGQCVMVDDCRWRAMQVPSAKYDPMKGFIMTRPTSFKLKFYPDKKSGKTKIPKSKDPDCGTYNSLHAFKRT